MAADQSIILEEYNENWPMVFKAEAARLNQLLSAYVRGSIEHVGSTSVPGLLAKPTIDIMIGVESLSASQPAINILTANGYCYYPYKPEQMHWFCAPSPEKRDFHVHLIPFESDLWNERLRFRDILRSNSKVRNEYAALKRQLMNEDAQDRERYTQLKWPFIKKTLSP